MAIPEMQNTVDKITQKAIRMAVLTYGVPTEQICTRCFRPMQPVGHKRELLCVQKDGEPGCDDPQTRSADICPECGEHRPDDYRVKNRMKCGLCAYGG